MVVRRFADREALDAWVPQWRAFVSRPGVQCGLWCDPTTVAELVRFGAGEELFLVEAARAGRAVAMLPFRVATSVVAAKVGWWTMARFRVRLARLTDADFAREPAEDAMDLLDRAMRAVAGAARCDVAVAPNWPIAGAESDQRPGMAVRHRQATYVVDMPASFDAYLESLAPKSRQTLRRKARKVERDRGTVLLKRFETVGECGDLEGVLTAVWRRSWHGKFGGQEPPGADFLAKMAGEGWLRSYALLVAGQPVATVLGFQYGGTFLDEAPAFDQAWREHSPGLVLSFLLMEDLFQHRPPRRVDFGFGYNQYKEVLGTRAETRGELWLGMTGKGRTALRAATAGDGVFRLGKAALNRFGVVRRLKSAMKEG